MAANSIQIGEKLGKRILDVSQLVDVFEAQEGVIEQIIGKTGNGKTYEGTRRALEYLEQGYVVYTTWHLVLPEKYDQRNDLKKLFWSLILFWRKDFYVFDYSKNWKHLDIDRPDLIDFVAGLTDCIVMLDEGQDIFDSYEGRGMSQQKRKTITRTRHLRKTLIIISQRAQAVAVTARANVTYFYKCVKTRAWYFPFVKYFKVYRTEEMDNQNFPIWEAPLQNWTAELWHSHFASQRIYDAYNSWYLRAGVKKSQDVYFEAYKLSWGDRLTGFFFGLYYSFFGKEKKTVEKVPIMETRPLAPAVIDIPQKPVQVKVSWGKGRRTRKVKIVKSPYVEMKSIDPVHNVIPLSNANKRKHSKVLEGSIQKVP